MPAWRASLPTSAAGWTRPPLVGTWVRAISLTRSSSSVRSASRSTSPDGIGVDDIDLDTGALGHLEKGDVVAGVLVGGGDDAVAGSQAQRVEGHLPGAGGVLQECYFVLRAVEKAGYAGVDGLQFAGNLVGGLVSADLLFKAEMFDDACHHRARLEAGAGVVEEDGLLAACSIGSEVVNIPIHWHAHHLFRESPVSPKI